MYEEVSKMMWSTGISLFRNSHRKRAFQPGIRKPCAILKAFSMVLLKIGTSKCMCYIHTCGRHSFQGNSKNMEGKFCFKCSSQILLCVNRFMQNGRVSVLNFILKELTSTHHIWVRFSPHLPLHSFINFYWRSYSLKKMSFLYLHVGPDVGISTLLSGLLECTLLFILKVQLGNTTTTSPNDWTL